MLKQIKSKLKDFFLARSVRSENKLRQDRVFDYKPFYELYSCLVLFEEGDVELNNKVMSLLNKELSRQDVTNMCVVSPDSELGLISSVVTVSKNDLSVSAKLINESVINRLNKKYDILIDLTESASDMVNYVLNKCQASYCVSYVTKKGIANISIVGCKDKIEFINGLIKIIKEVKRV